MTKFRKSTLALATVGALAAAIPGIASADALATSTLEMTNFRLLHSSGAVYDISDFFAIVPASSASISAVYNNNNGTNVNNTLAGGPTPTGQIDLFPACSGPGCNQNGSLVHGVNFNGVLDNSFPKLNNPTNPTGSNFVASDQQESGSPLSGQIDPSTGLAIPAGATVKSGSWTSLTGTSTGPNNAEANNQLNTTWQFTLAQACLLYTSPSPRDRTRSRMPSSA